MTIGAIARQVAFYLHQKRSVFVDENGDDMIIAALNLARKDGEGDLWFNNQRYPAWLSVGASVSASLDGAKLVSSAGAFTETAVSVKGVRNVYLGNDLSIATYYPVFVESKDLAVLKTREAGLYAMSPDFIDRYPGDYAPPSRISNLNLLFDGSNIGFSPPFTTTKVVALDAYLWMDDYIQNRVIVATSSTTSATVTLAATPPANFVVGSVLLGQTVTVIATLTVTLAGNANATIAANVWKPYTTAPGLVIGNGGEDYENWFCKHGSNYLIFGAICKLNLFSDRFVLRAEGFNAPPEKARDVALAKLQSYDALMFEHARMPFLNR